MKLFTIFPSRLKMAIFVRLLPWSIHKFIRAKWTGKSKSHPSKLFVKKRKEGEYSGGKLMCV